MSRRRENGMFTFRDVPKNIRELLVLLTESGEDVKVTIILDGEDEETVEIEAVVGNMLVSTINGGCFKFVDIDCICAVIVPCEAIVENIFRNVEFSDPCCSPCSDSKACIASTPVSKNCPSSYRSMVNYIASK